MREEIEQFSGSEKSIFADRIKDAIFELTDLLTECSNIVFELKTKQGITSLAPSDKKKIADLRGKLYTVYLFTSEKIATLQLKNNILEFLKVPFPDSKDTEKYVSSASKLIQELFNELSAIGFIDLKGSSYAGAYPFKQLLFERISSKQCDISNLSKFELNIINILSEQNDNRENSLIEPADMDEGDILD